MKSQGDKKIKNLDLTLLTEEEILLLEHNQEKENTFNKRKKPSLTFADREDGLVKERNSILGYSKELDNSFFYDKIVKEYSKKENSLSHSFGRSTEGERISSYMEEIEKRKDTITIRTIPLGNDSSLTISETYCAGKVVAICSLSGYLDQSNAEIFQDQLISMIEFGVRFFVIDLGLAYMVGSSGWGSLAMLSKLIKNSSGHLIVCEMKKEVEENFYLLQFNEIIDVQPTIEESLKVITSFIEHKKEKKEVENLNVDNSCADLPLPEKIKDIIARYGEISFFKILARLKEDRYGRVNISPIKLYLLLRELNLDKKWKRLRFYRAC